MMTFGMVLINVTFCGGGTNCHILAKKNSKQPKNLKECFFFFFLGVVFLTFLNFKKSKKDFIKCNKKIIWGFLVMIG